MKRLEIYKCYVVRDNIILQIDKDLINEGELFLYIGSTPTTPVNYEFIFGYKKEDSFNWISVEYLYDIHFIIEDNAKNKLIRMSKTIKDE